MSKFTQPSARHLAVDCEYAGRAPAAAVIRRKEGRKDRINSAVRKIKVSFSRSRELMRSQCKNGLTEENEVRKGWESEIRPVLPPSMPNCEIIRATSVTVSG